MADPESTDAPQTPQTAPDPAKNPMPTVTASSVIPALAALVVMSALSAWIVHYYAADTATNAATILGIVIPAFATIGGAAFGVSVAYKSGNERGKVSGQAQGRAAAAGALASQLKEAQQAVATLKDQLQTQASSHPGSRDLLFGAEAIHVSQGGEAPQPLRINAEQLEAATESLARASGAAESWLAGPAGPAEG